MAIQSIFRASRNMALLVYLLCGAMVLAFAASNLFVLDTAGYSADQVRLKAERDLVKNEIDRQIEIVARDQSQISHWDATLKALGPSINMEFIRTEIADWLWEDFGIQSSIIISPDGKPRVTVFKDEVLAAEAGQAVIDLNADLVRDARAVYMKHRKQRDGGFAIFQHPIRSHKPIFVSDVRPIDGQISVVVAQAIIPDDQLTLPDGHPQVLLTYKPLTRSVVHRMSEKLGLSNLKIEPKSDKPAAGEANLVLSKSGYHAVWRASAPSQAIWERTLPLIGVLLLAIAAALVLVSTRYGGAVKALQKSEERNRFLALHDALTGLPNRLQFESALEDIVEEGAQDRCAILCMDLDKFKAVNDTYGHQAGDTVIVTAANRIAACVGEAGMAARVGGDEFIVLLRDRLDHQNVLRLCDDLIRSVCQDIPFDGGTAQIGASIGVAWWPDDAKTASNIIRSADEALYRAKENGRGRAYLASGKGQAIAA